MRPSEGHVAPLGERGSSGFAHIGFRVVEQFAEPPDGRPLLLRPSCEPRHDRERSGCAALGRSHPRCLDSVVDKGRRRPASDEPEAFLRLGPRFRDRKVQTRDADLRPRGGRPTGGDEGHPAKGHKALESQHLPARNWVVSPERSGADSEV